MDYVYNYKIETDLPDTALKQICDKAVQRARLQAPVKTGNLRRSIKYSINDDIVMLYIDTTMFKVPYYEYANEVHKKSGKKKSSNGYWYDVVAEFGTILYGNLDRAFKEEIQREKENEAKEAEIQAKLKAKNEEIKKRKEGNDKLTETLKQLALLYAVQNIESLQELINAKR